MPGPRIWNEQLIRYAGYATDDGSIVGDPRYVDFTDAAAQARLARWSRQPLRRAAAGDLDGGRRRRCSPRSPGDAVLEVPLRIPTYPWFEQLGLRWHAVPAISTCAWRSAGSAIRAAPFNGWYMGTEIGARNLADTDRYDLLPVIARRMGLDTANDRSLWRDHALVELNMAVLHSFEQAGVTMTDHHTESRHFLTHLEREEKAGRVCPADWTWIVPPMSRKGQSPWTVRQSPVTQSTSKQYARTSDPLRVLAYHMSASATHWLWFAAMSTTLKFDSMLPHSALQSPVRRRLR